MAAWRRGLDAVPMPDTPPSDPGGPALAVDVGRARRRRDLEAIDRHVAAGADRWRSSPTARTRWPSASRPDGTISAALKAGRHLRVLARVADGATETIVFVEDGR